MKLVLTQAIYLGCVEARDAQVTSPFDNYEEGGTSVSPKNDPITNVNDCTIYYSTLRKWPGEGSRTEERENK